MFRNTWGNTRLSRHEMTTFRIAATIAACGIAFGTIGQFYFPVLHGDLLIQSGSLLPFPSLAKLPHPEYRMPMDPRKVELNRREFARLALMSSALLMGPARWAHGDEPDVPPVSYFGAFRALPPGSVQPEGWLRAYLEKQAAQLGSKLPEVSWPFTAAYWEEEQEGESWWPWEQKAYWVDGATRLAVVLQDEKLLAQATRPIEYTLAHLGDNGYLGPDFFEEPKGDFHRWPQNLFLRGMSAAYDGEHSHQNANRRIVDAIKNHYLADPASYGAPSRNVTNLENMLWCYERTGDAKLLALAETSWRGFMAVGADTEHGDLSALRVFAATPINAHGVTYAETAKQPAILYMYTGKQDYLKFALAAQRRIFDHHMLIDGIPSTSEFFRTVTSLDSHETCDIADHTWSWGYMLLATGDGVWGDRVERACFNAAPGAIKNDWKALQYFSCPNQFLAMLDSDHNVMAHGSRMMAYQPNPGQRTACCGGNVHRIFPNYVIRMWMKSNDGGLVASLYGPSKLKTTVGADKQPIEIVQTTNYPFGERIRFEIHTDRPVSFPLSLRIPGWCVAPKLAVNGAAVDATRSPNGFVVLNRSFKSGDTITLDLSMKLAITRWPQNGVGVERGPLVYSFPIAEKWTTKVERKFSTVEFPSWEATPAGPWNYGLALDASKLESQVEITKKAASADAVLDPWENPPITLAVHAKKIEGWELQSNPDKPDQKFTPSLPDMSTCKVSDRMERVALVPYGSTQLRLTIFPALES